MIGKKEKDSIIETLGRNKEVDRYYVYALCDKKSTYKVPFYIGKGQEDRLWQHELETKKERELIEKTLRGEEKVRALEELSAKHRLINEIGKDNIEKIILKWGMTEAEAFCAEAALINLFNLEGLCFPQNNKLTNKQGGHRTKKEKERTQEGKAYLLDDFYRQCCLPALDFGMDESHSMVFVNINQLYAQCLSEGSYEDIDNNICDCARGIWGFGNNRLSNPPEYLVAMYRNRICGIYKVDEMKRVTDTSDYPTFPKNVRSHEKKMFEEFHKCGAVKGHYDILSQEAKTLFEEYVQTYAISAQREYEKTKKWDYSKEFDRFINRKYLSCSCAEKEMQEKYNGRIIMNNNKSIMSRKGFVYKNY